MLVFRLYWWVNHLVQQAVMEILLSWMERTGTPLHLLPVYTIKTYALSTRTQVFFKNKLFCHLSRKKRSVTWQTDFFQIFQNPRYSVVMLTGVFASWHHRACWFLLCDWPTRLGSHLMWKTQMRQNSAHSWQMHHIFRVVCPRDRNSPLLSCLQFYLWKDSIPCLVWTQH